MTSAQRVSGEGAYGRRAYLLHDGEGVGVALLHALLAQPRQYAHGERHDSLRLPSAEAGQELDGTVPDLQALGPCVVEPMRRRRLSERRIL